MERINIFLIFFLVAIWLFFVQYSWMIAIWGVNPNIIMVGALFFAFLSDSIWIFLGLEILFFIFASSLGIFWSGHVLLVLGLAFIFHLFKKLMTGSVLIDFITVIFLSTVIFEIVSNFVAAAQFNFLMMLKEIIYNAFFGLFLWFALCSFFPKLRQAFRFRR